MDTSPEVRTVLVSATLAHVTVLILVGGSMCMDLLTSDGWLPSYSIPAILLQIKLAISNLEPQPARLAQNWNMCVNVSITVRQPNGHDDDFLQAVLNVGSHCWFQEGCWHTWMEGLERSGYILGLSKLTINLAL